MRLPGALPLEGTTAVDRPLGSTFDKDFEAKMNAAVQLGRWTSMSAGPLLLLCTLCFPPQAMGNIWESTFGQRWFHESRAWANQTLSGTWWESSLTPGETYKITFEVNHLSGRANLFVGERNVIDINRTGWHSYDFNIWEGGERRMMFTTRSNNTTMGVRNISVTPKWGSGTATPTGSGSWMPKGHYLAFARQRNLKTEVLDLIDNPSKAPSNWHLNNAYEVKDGLTTPGVKGFSVLLNWKTIEVGDGKFDWRLLDANMAVARRFGLKFIAEVATRSFDGTNVMPRYFPGQYTVWSQGGGKSGYVAKLWDPWVHNRLIRLYKAIARRYGNDGAFGGISTSETALGNLGGGNYSYSQYRNALIKIATEAQSVLKNARLFMYLNFLKGGQDFDMRKDGRVSLVRNIPHHAVAIGAPDITGDRPGMPGSLNSYRIHVRKNLSHVEQFCHAQHVDQGEGKINRKNNTQRQAYFDLVRKVRAREQQSWFNGQSAIFEFDDLRDPNGRKVDYHPSWVVGQLWNPRETFAFANRNFGCDYFIWHFRDSMFSSRGEFWWEDIRPVIVNNQHFFK